MRPLLRILRDPLPFSCPCDIVSCNPGSWCLTFSLLIRCVLSSGRRGFLSFTDGNTPLILAVVATAGAAKAHGPFSDDAERGLAVA